MTRAVVVSDCAHTRRVVAAPLCADCALSRVDGPEVARVRAWEVQRVR